MVDDLKPLKKGDKVVIKEWGVTGTVTVAHPADPPDDGIYEVQARPQFFRRSTLELDTSDADREKHRQAIEEKVARLDVAWQKLLEATSNGRVPSPAIFKEYIAAETALRKEQGVPSLIAPLFTPRTKE
jgi:hypothetical protein